MRYIDIVAKMREEHINDFSQAELTRVFENCASPIACKRGVNYMLESGLTIDEIYIEKQKTLFEVMK